MFKYQKDGISVISILDKRRKLDSGLYRVRIRVIFQRNVKEYNTGKELSEDDWNMLMDARKPKLVEIRNDIQSSFDNVVNSVKEISNAFSFDALNIRLGFVGSNSLNASFQSRIEEIKSEGRIGTSVNYTYSLKAIERFAGTNIPINAVTVSWLEKFERFLLDEGKSYTTIGMYCRPVRAIFGILKESGIIKESAYPFGSKKYQIPESAGRKTALSINQIAQIFNYQDNYKKTELYRDLWIFSYLCNGINMTDMLNLKFADIIDGEIYWLRKKTVKTNKKKEEIRATLLPEMQRIIDLHGNPPLPDNYIFPFLKGGEKPIRQREIVMDITKRVNRKMKVIGKNLGIGNISTYTARHSFSTILKYSGASPNFIREQLGHASLATTENYLKSFEKDERTKNAALLTKFE